MEPTECIGRSASPTGLRILRGIGFSEYQILATMKSIETKVRPG
jgi:hypothetical protein